MAGESKSRRAFEERVNRLVRAFVAIVRSSFGYLLDEYGFSSNEPEYLWFNNSRDALVRISYRRWPVQIDVDFRPGENLIAVGLNDLKNGRASDLESLISLRTQGAVAPILPPIDSSLTFAEMKRRAARREHLVSTELQNVVRELAARLKTNATDILKGETDPLIGSPTPTDRP